MSTKKPAKKTTKGAPARKAGAVGVSRDVAPEGFFARILLPVSPLTPDTDPLEPGIHFLVSPEDYEKTALSQRRYFEELATKLESSESLDEAVSIFDRLWAAGAIRAFASQIPLSQPRGKGQLPKVDPGKIAIEFALMTETKGFSKNAAMEKLAEENEVSVEAIRKALRKYGPTATSWFSNLKKK